MKKIIYTLCLTFLICTLGQSQNVPSYVPTNGLVGWWPFNGNANDEPGNGNNGTVNGATLTADRFGNSNSAFSFNGNGNKITCNPISNTQAITISIWNYVVTGGGGEMCVQNNPQNCTNVSFDFQVGRTNPLVGIAHNGINCSQIGANLNTVSNYNISSVMGSWNHYVGVIMSSGNSYLYINGVLVDSSLNNLGFNSCPITNSSLRFGGPWWNGDNQWFSGKLDDIGIWNRALTQQEITALFNSSTTSIAENSPSSIINIFPNPVAEYLNVKSDAEHIGSSYRIVDAAGRIITTGRINSESMIVDMGQYASGMYLLMIGEGGNSFKIFKD